MSDLSTTAAAEASAPTRSVPTHIVISEKDFAVLADLRQRCEQARAQFNSAAEDAKSKKKAFEGAREVFETNFDRIFRRAKGEDLPLFNQSELLERAQADPVVMKLVDRLLAAGFDVNAILVSGYTQDERAQASAYLDAVDAHNAAVETGDEDTKFIAPEPPPFLLPQPLTPIELADLAKRLGEKELTIRTDQLASFGKAQIAEVREYLDRVAVIEKDKGESLTVSDLPEPPAFLVEADAANVEAGREAEAATGEELGDADDADDEEVDEPQKVH